MQYMVIERFKNRNAKAVYDRFRAKGRMMPEGLSYIGSWVEPNFDRCFQVVECAGPQVLEEWIRRWADLMDFECVPVISSQQAMEALDAKP